MDCGSNLLLTYICVMLKKKTTQIQAADVIVCSSYWPCLWRVAWGTLGVYLTSLKSTPCQSLGAADGPYAHRDTLAAIRAVENPGKDVPGNAGEENEEHEQIHPARVKSLEPNRNSGAKGY